MDKKTVNESQYFVAWLLFWISSALGGALIGAVAGGVVGGLLGILHASPRVIQMVCGSLGFILSIPLSYVLFRVFVGTMIVNKIKAAE